MKSAPSLICCAHDRDQLGGVVRIIGVGEHVLRGVVADGVFVAAENIDGIAADAQARPGNQPIIDGVANRCVGGARAFGPHVAFGGEAGHQVVPRRQRRQDRALRHGLLHRLQIFRAGMQKQVHVRVDQARQQSAVAQIDHLRTRRTLHRRAHFHNAFSFY